MGKKATLATSNMFYTARYLASASTSGLQSREGAAELLGINQTRLARIELGKINPYPEEVLKMSQLYKSPELCNSFCAKECPLGKQTISELPLDDLDRLMLKVLGSLKGIEELRTRLITLAEDGEIKEEERPEFNDVLSELRDVSKNALTLQLWAEKYIGSIEG